MFLDLFFDITDIQLRLKINDSTPKASYISYKNSQFGSRSPCRLPKYEMMNAAPLLTSLVQPMRTTQEKVANIRYKKYDMLIQSNSNHYKQI